MILYPAIDLKEGRCVRLRQGDMAQATIFNADPAAQAARFEADGFLLPLDKLLEAGLPAIVLLNDRGYRHFVVVKGLRGGRVLVGDPARGTRSFARPQFERLWDNRVLFVVHNRRESAAFNLARDWRTAPPAPLDSAIGRQGLRDIVVPRRGAGDI